jgi:tetratricopeptide (TPR) repeat protein
MAFDARRRNSPNFPVKAADFFERAVQLDPNFAIAWARLSRADGLLYYVRDVLGTSDHLAAARRDASKRALDNAQRLAPNSPQTLLALGYYQIYVLNDPEAGKTTFIRVKKILPGNSEVLLALNRVSRGQGHWDETVAYVEQALTLDPRNVQLLVDAAWVYARVRQFERALKLYDRALDITPNNPDVMTAKAGIYQAQGNLPAAARLLVDVNERTPSDDTFSAKVTQLQLERNLDEAIRLLKARLSQFHYDSEWDKALDEMQLGGLQRLAGDSLGAKSNGEQARNILERLRRNLLDDYNLAVNLSGAYAAMGQKESALKEAKRAIMLLLRVKDPVVEPGAEENLAVVQTIFGENSRAISNSFSAVANTLL